MKKTSKSPAGTSHHGHTIRATRQELIDALGQPDAVGDADEKSLYEWHRETENGDVFTIYDWKEYYHHSAEVQLSWHIGGYSSAAALSAQRELQAWLSPPLGEDIYTDAERDTE